MNCVKVGCDVFFFYCCYIGFGDFGVFVFVDKGGNIWVIFCSCFGKWVLSCNCNVSYIYKCIWMSGVYG